MEQTRLFSDLPVKLEGKPGETTRPQDARVVHPLRNRIQFLMQDLDATLPEDLQARAIWEFLDRLDLSAFYASIQAVEGGPGRPASDPQVLLAVWVYATVEGVGSARKLDRLCREHDAYRWLCRGVPVDYHLLSDFRREHQEALNELLTQIVATLLAENLVTLKEVAQDGVRIRTSAGSGSFRGKARLEKCLEAAQAQVEMLAQEREHPDPGVSRRERAAREWAARSRAARAARVEEALRQLPEVQAVKERQKRHAGKKRAAKVTEARVSTTDPDARVMKMPGREFRPAYNLQFATDVDSQVIVAVAVVNRGNDQGEGLVMGGIGDGGAGGPADGAAPWGLSAGRGICRPEGYRGVGGTWGASIRATQEREGRSEGDPEARLRAGGDRLAGAHGDRRGSGHLSTPGVYRGMCQWNVSMLRPE